MVEELHHEFHNLRIVAEIVSFLGGPRVALGRLQLEGAAFAFLLCVRIAFSFETMVAPPYLESALLERGPEVAGLSHENDLVKIKLV